MPRVAPFAGLHYSVTRFASAQVADLTDVVCPPYDVISDEQRRELLERHDRNAVRLEYSAEPDPHAAAADELATWIADGTLELRSEPAAYAYRHGTSSAPDGLGVEGIVVRVLLEPWGGGIRPHEHTMPGPKADRLALLAATRTQLSPILAVYFDPSGESVAAMAASVGTVWRALDGDGLLHQLAAFEAGEDVLAHLGRQTLFVADGHHRYETALSWQARVRSDPRSASAQPGELSADWTMMLVVNAERAELEIQPTHRILLDTDADADALRALVAGDDPLFESIPVAPERLASALAERSAAADVPTFGLVLPGNDGFLLIGDADGLDDRLRREGMGDAVRSLDLSSLHVAVLADRLGITSADVAAGRRLAYTRDEAEARERVAGGTASAAILVRPTPLRALAAVAGEGDVMPQKSTYFYPKPLTGMVFNPLED